MAESPEDGIRIQLEQTRYDFAFHRHEPMPGVKELRSFFAYTDYEHAEVEPNGEVGTTYSNRSHQLRVELVHQDVGAWHGVVGLQVGGSKFSALGEEAFIPVTKSDQIGLFWIEDLHLADSMLEFGVRLDRDERDPQNAAAPGESFNSVSASASWLKPLASGWQLSAALSRAERAPAIEELYSNYGLTDPETWVVHAATEAIEIGSADLDTEVSNNLDLSISRSWGAHFIEGVVYYNAFSDYIGLVADQVVGSVDEYPVFRYKQLDADFYGAELSSYWGLGEVLDGDLALEVNADFIRGEFSGSLGNVPRMPADRLFLKAEWRGDRVYAWSRVTHAFEQDRVATAEEATESYTRWDLGAEWAVDAAQQWTVFASLNNLTDEEIRYSTSFLKDIAPEAGRGIEIGFRGAF